MDKYKLISIALLLLSFNSCEKNNNGISTNSLSGFRLIKSYTVATRLNLLYPDDFSGSVSYIVSSENLNINSEAEFNASSGTKKEVVITNDSLHFNNYIDISSLSASTNYFVYILDNTSSEVKILFGTTGNTPDFSSETGTVSDGDEAHTYTLYFPAGYDSDLSKKWPFIVSIKAPAIIPQNPEFPCIVFNINASYMDWDRYQTFYTNMKSTLNTILGNNSYRIDKDRLYAIGFSVGGCWAMDIANNDGSDDYQFAAVVGVGISNWLGQDAHCHNLGNTDIWLFYGEEDIAYGINGTKVAFQTIPRLTGEHLLTEMPGVGHNAAPAWASPYTFEWMLSK